jgi:hypothetical protein
MYNNTMSSIVKDHPSVVSKKYILGADDICDKCRARAFIKVKGRSGELTFCNHHYEKIMNTYESYEKMMSFMVEVIDERERLIQKKPIGGI